MPATSTHAQYAPCALQSRMQTRLQLLALLKVVDLHRDGSWNYGSRLVTPGINSARMLLVITLDISPVVDFGEDDELA